MSDTSVREKKETRLIKNEEALWLTEKGLCGLVLDSSDQLTQLFTSKDHLSEAVFGPSKIYPRDDTVGYSIFSGLRRRERTRLAYSCGSCNEIRVGAPEIAIEDNSLVLYCKSDKCGAVLEKKAIRI